MRGLVNHGGFDYFDAQHMPQQIDNGFRIVTILHEYIRDEVTNGDSALIVWDNPQYKPT